MSLYQEAIVELLGGVEKCRGFTGSNWKGMPTGRQSVTFVEEDASLLITCVKNKLKPCHFHLQRFLRNTELKAIYWVNVVSGCVRFQKIVR